MIPNRIEKIIFIITDALRAKNVGVYGANPSPTPHIDEFAKTSIVFLNAYTSITYTDPSITSIMTGCYPISVGLVNHGKNIREEEEKEVSKSTLLPEILKSHGYKTAAVDWLARWHREGYDYYSGPIDKNFIERTPPRLPIPFLLRIIDKLAVKLLRREFIMRFYYAFSQKPIIPYDPADLVINEGIKILKKSERQRLFLYLHLWDPHFPHTRPKGFKSYLLDDVGKTYNAEILFMDKQIGRLVEYLKKTTQLDKTLIILTSDHGENLHEHDIPFNHENLYEDIVKVPLLFKCPLFSTRKISALVQHVDILPTIFDLVNISIPKHLDGISLLPLMLGKSKKARDFLYFEDLAYRKINIPRPKRRRGIRIANYKYIETLVGKNESLYSVIPGENIKVSRKELYNLKTDPLEKKNIIKEKSVVAKRLKSRLYKIISNLNTKRLGIN